MKKCPCCGSTRIVKDNAGNIHCKKCGYILLTEKTRRGLNEVFQNSKK
jgi:transcription initiation factor TFIIIB Brf1 subunit/transcription initiation factor TFIIB